MPNGAQTLAASEADILAADFTDNSMVIKDTVTPANDYYSVPFSKLTFTRASTGYYYNSAGVLTSAATNAARIDYNPATLALRGFLTEEARTNLNLRSQEFDNGAWAKSDSTITVNAIDAPDGTATSDKIVEAATTAQHSVSQTNTLTAAAYTHSEFCKAGERTWAYLRLAAAAGQGAYFDLTNGLVGTVETGITAAIQNVGNGWYRCSVTITTTAATWYAQVMPASADNTSTYLGDITKGIYIWGSQVELGAWASSYIPTTSPAVTRAADVCTIATSLFNHSATLGTLYLNSIPMYTGSIQTGLLFDDGTANELFNLGSSAAAAASFSVIDGGAAQTAPLTTGTVAVGTVDKLAATWAANDFALVKDGGTVATDGAGTLPTVTTLRLGVNKWHRQIAHIPRRMSNAEIQVFPPAAPPGPSLRVVQSNLRW